MLLRRKPRILALNAAALDAIEPALLVLGADEWWLAAGRLVEAQIAHRRLITHKSVNQFQNCHGITKLQLQTVA